MAIIHRWAENPENLVYKSFFEIWQCALGTEDIARSNGAIEKHKSTKILHRTIKIEQSNCSQQKIA